MNSTWGKQSNSKEEIKFLTGPLSWTEELFRLVRITTEFFKGFRAFYGVGPCITVFGSARFTEEHPYYKMAQKIGYSLSKSGLNVMTGGGPGIMEAANRGAKEANGGYSIGCNIKLPKEQKPNPYLNKWITFRYFFIRKMMLVKYSKAFIVLPGGFGTMDEIFETATLIQTGKIFDFPLILVGKEYWQPLFDFINKSLLKEKTINSKDLNLLTLTDSIDEAVEIAIAAAKKNS